MMAMIEMVVEGIGIDPQNNPLVLLRDEARTTFVPIWIGPSEALSIQMELDNRQSQRPMTHDLIANVFRELGIHLLRVTVNDFSDSVYYASLHVQVGSADQVQELDARPSDAIALALRAQCQILVSDAVSQKAGIQVEDVSSTERPLENEISKPDDRSQAPESKQNASPDEVERLTRLLEGVDLGGESDKN